MAKTRKPAADKAAKAEAKAARKAASKQRRSQLWQAFQIQRKEDKRLLPYMIGAFVLIVAAAVAAGIFIGGFTMFMLIPLGIVLGALVAFIIFGRRAQQIGLPQGRRADRVRPPGHWTTCAANGGSPPASRRPATSTRCTG